nr:hypothetical protein [Pseudodesulfovibrio sp.]
MYIIHHPNTRLICASEEIVNWQWNVLFSIGRSHIYRKHLQSLLERLADGDYKNAVTQTQNTMFSTFLLDWCKIFGANNNEIHWKKALLNHKTIEGHTICTKQQYATIVKQFIFEHAEITEAESQSATNAMKDARNKYAAHINFQRMPVMPYLDIPYKIARAYYAFLFKVQGVHKTPWNDLEGTFNNEINIAFPMPIDE